MSDNWTDSEFDGFLRDAMASRPEPAAPTNLAEVATRLARADERLSRVARIQRRNNLVGFVAALMVAVVLLLGGLRLSGHANASNSSTDLSETQSLQSTSSTGESQSAFSRPVVLLTGEALLAALILLSASRPILIRHGASATDLVFH